jgi:hypothetical protein
MTIRLVLDVLGDLSDVGAVQSGLNFVEHKEGGPLETTIEKIT